MTTIDTPSEILADLDLIPDDVVPGFEILADCRVCGEELLLSVSQDFVAVPNRRDPGLSREVLVLYADCDACGYHGDEEIAWGEIR